VTVAGGVTDVVAARDGVWVSVALLRDIASVSQSKRRTSRAPLLK